MTARRDFLVEIGTEELPPAALRALMEGFAAALTRELSEHRLDHGAVRMYATPRRLALLVADLVDAQQDREVELKGPPVAVAFDDSGRPTAAAEAFAGKCGAAITELERRSTDKGEWLYYRTLEKGAATRDLAASTVAAALSTLPIPRPMRWGEGAIEFVRPPHWILLRHGDETLPGRILGVEAGNRTFGHRFLAPGAIDIDVPSDYAGRLEESGRVIADYDRRLERVRELVENAASEAGGRAVADQALFEEVTALVEWPVGVVAEFEDSFLELPREVVIATLVNHQRYFPIEDEHGRLLAKFVVIANIETPRPEIVRHGNERVVRPRLADAAFFWEADRSVPLAERRAALEDVVYQRGLGSMAARSRRISVLASGIAAETGADGGSAERAGLLSKCDLVTGMVGEFPELQGTMGRYYAESSGEPAAVAIAIGEHYRPRFAADAIPATAAGRALAVADRTDTLCGIFALGKKPSGNRDPFGLRRAALGIVRILVEAELDLPLDDLIDAGLRQQPVEPPEGARDAVREFILERFRAYAIESFDIGTEVFEAVRVRRPDSLVDFAERLRAVRAFVELESAQSLAAANKRIGNILRQAGYDGVDALEVAAIEDGTERRLYEELRAARDVVAPLLEQRRYRDVLSRLAELRDPVDRFFDDVMVMVEDERVRRNRLTLLAELREQFLRVADVSRLAIQK